MADGGQQWSGAQHRTVAGQVHVYVCVFSCISWTKTKKPRESSSQFNGLLVANPRFMPVGCVISESSSQWRVLPEAVRYPRVTSLSLKFQCQQSRLTATQ